MIQIDQRAVDNIVNSSTPEKEMLVCIEELAELQKELCKEIRGKGNWQAIYEEMSDVLLTVEIMRHLFSFTEEQIQQMISYKLGRTLADLKKEKNKDEQMVAVSNFPPDA